MGGLSVEMKLCRGDCSLVVSSEKFASPFTLAVEQTCASVEHYTNSDLSQDDVDNSKLERFRPQPLHEPPTKLLPDTTVVIAS